jgi:hypothetical protein
MPPRDSCAAPPPAPVSRPARPRRIFRHGRRPAHARSARTGLHSSGDLSPTLASTFGSHGGVYRSQTASSPSTAHSHPRSALSPSLPLRAKPTRRVARATRVLRRGLGDQKARRTARVLDIENASSPHCQPTRAAKLPPAQTYTPRSCSFFGTVLLPFLIAPMVHPDPLRTRFAGMYPSDRTQRF